MDLSICARRTGAAYLETSVLLLVARLVRACLSAESVQFSALVRMASRAFEDSCLLRMGDLVSVRRSCVVWSRLILIETS